VTFLVIDKQRFAYFSRLAPRSRNPVPGRSRVEFLDRTGKGSQDLSRVNYSGRIPTLGRFRLTVFGANRSGANRS
jgi:hypothetical protein